MTNQYIYGVTYTDTSLPADLHGIGGAAVTLVTHNQCGALVSDLPADRPLGTRDDLLSHERVLEELARRHIPVLPFRFGAAMTGPQEISDELLAANQDAFLADLEQIRGRVELVVKGRYENDSAYLEVLREEPAVLELRERIRGVPEEASYDERLRLGEVIAQAMARKQSGDTDRLAAALSPYAEQVAPRPPAREDEVANLAFLVEQGQQDGFEEAIEELGRQWAGRVRLRLIGPLPPYDFVGSLQGRQS
ncbi:GvpL/GvpF family gas vesicle protein [Nonomuraea basaltis]|uniref:GvpL/GvpF family gas vesicle protein n=1 Tax=Nonomuraea basaltis TaxID=2495887 RepID=UPI00110C67B1|nr:GvpL/GvpF family gas vesicle protein [Nonomuraea basaltis]TMR97964.1 GvpL/GvpF family gas vesicle protein [Nonomuraea basaltis]